MRTILPGARAFAHRYRLFLAVLGLAVGFGLVSAMIAYQLEDFRCPASVIDLPYHYGSYQRYELNGVPAWEACTNTQEGAASSIGLRNGVVVYVVLGFTLVVARVLRSPR